MPVQTHSVAKLPSELVVEGLRHSDQNLRHVNPYSGWDALGHPKPTYRLIVIRIKVKRNASVYKEKNAT